VRLLTILNRRDALSVGALHAGTAIRRYAADASRALTIETTLSRRTLRVGRTELRARRERQLQHDCRQHLSARGIVFSMTGSGAAVTADVFAVVALFICIHDAVAAAREPAVGAAVRAGRVAVLRTVVAFLTRIQNAVAAERQHEAAVTVAADGAVDRGFALLAEKRLHDAVAARAGKAMAALITDVAGVPVQSAVVAFLSGIEKPVAACAATAIDASPARAALLVIAARDARAILAQPGRALIAVRTRYAVSVFTNRIRAAVGIGSASAATAVDAFLPSTALRIGRAQTAHAVLAQPRRALFVRRAIRTLAVEAQIARALVVIGARDALAVLTQPRCALQVVRALLALPVDTQTREALIIVLAERDGRCG